MSRKWNLGLWLVDSLRRPSNSARSEGVEAKRLAHAVQKDMAEADSAMSLAISGLQSPLQVLQTVETIGHQERLVLSETPDV